MNRDDYKNQNRESLGLKLVPPTDEPVDERPVALLIAMYHGGVYNSDSIVRAFEQNGYRTVVIDWQKIKLNEGFIGVWDRILGKAAIEKPSIIWMHMQTEAAFDIDSLAELKNYAPVVNYTMDVRNIGAGWFKKAGQYVALSCMACQEDVDELKEAGHNAILLNSSCDMDFYKPNPKPYVTHGVYTPDIVFIGKNYENVNLNFPLATQRQEMVAFLKETYGDKFCSYGGGQQENRFIFQHEELNLYQSAKIVIGHNNFLRKGYSSDRMWRIMASGAFCLTSWFPGIAQLFSSGFHLDWWKNFGELKLLIDMYLDDEKNRKAIAKMGTQVVRENHGWANRIAVIKETLRVHP